MRPGLILYALGAVPALHKQAGEMSRVFKTHCRAIVPTGLRWSTIFSLARSIILVKSCNK